MHQNVHFRNFTVFADATFSFVPGINVLVGENGTGKTHLMKALYASQLGQVRRSESLLELFQETFQTEDVTNLLRNKNFSIKAQGWPATYLMGQYNDQSWEVTLYLGTPLGTASGSGNVITQRPVYIPAIDMMGHTKGFVEAYDEVQLDFDRTCRDVVNLLRLERRNGRKEAMAEAADNNLASNVRGQRGWQAILGDILQGNVERDEAGRFYLVNTEARRPMPLVAEGLRKIATLVQLGRNGWLAPGTTLFWDEPEVNLNPVLMDEVVGAIWALARSGVQVVLATHSYVILQEVEVQAEREDKFRFFTLQATDKGVQVSSANSYLDISPNPIEAQYTSLYDRRLAKQIARLEQG